MKNQFACRSLEVSTCLAVKRRKKCPMESRLVVGLLLNYWKRFTRKFKCPTPVWPLGLKEQREWSPFFAVSVMREPIWAETIKPTASDGLSNGRKRSPRAGKNLRKDRKSTRLNSSHLGISYAV